MTEYGVPGYSISEHKCLVIWEPGLSRWGVYCDDCPRTGVVARFALWADAVSLALMHHRIQWCTCSGTYGGRGWCLVHG